jgi:hypothetical protein
MMRFDRGKEFAPGTLSGHQVAENSHHVVSALLQ